MVSYSARSVERQLSLAASDYKHHKKDNKHGHEDRNQGAATYAHRTLLVKYPDATIRAACRAAECPPSGGAGDVEQLGKFCGGMGAT